MEELQVASFEQRLGEIDTVQVSSFGKSMVIAPHPDDETLGCGGTVALLFNENIPVHFIFMSDGTMSHPNSEQYPSDKLRALREMEAIEAVKILGGDVDHIEFLAFPDRSVPSLESLFFESAVRLLFDRINKIQPDTIFIPWQNDPHPDHRASWQIVFEAVSRLKSKPELVQYPIWLWEMGNRDDIVQIETMNVFCVDITETLPSKMKALAAHESQVSNLINDDPHGFRLSEQDVAHFNRNREIFFKNQIDK